jgi:hypothetical protein
MPIRLYSLYKIGSNEPEFTGDTREEIKRKNTHANTREGRKGGHSVNPRRWLRDMKVGGTQLEASPG